MAQIKITDLTNATDVDNGVSNGTGIFDKLMESVTNVISDQYDSGRLNGQEFATVLTGGIQAVLQESVQYALQSQLIGAQIDEITKNIDVKERSTVLQETESADKLLTSAKQRILLDEEKETADKNQLLLDLQNAIDTYKKDTLLPDEHNINLEKIDSIIKDIDVKERNMVLQESELSDKLLTSVKQRVLLDEEKETEDKKQVLLSIQNDIETYKKDTLLPDEHSINLEKINSITKDIDVKERNTVVQEKESYIKRVAEDKTAALLGLDNVVKTLNATPEEVYTIKYKEV